MKKRLISCMLIFLLLFSFLPVNVNASVTINKRYATMEVDSILKLSIKGTKSKISWTTNKSSIASVSNVGLVTALKEGEAVITATVNSKKYKCNVKVVDNNKKKKPTPTPSPKKENITIEEFEEYLTDTYSSIKTDMGKIQFEYKVYKSSSKVFAYDYSISVDWDGVSPFDIEYSKSYTDKQKKNTKTALKKLQQSIYEDAVSFFPDTKFEGGFISSWYEYPTLKVGYNSIRFLTWCNYTESNDVYPYDTSLIGDFRWTPVIDDYDFTK